MPHGADYLEDLKTIALEIAFEVEASRDMTFEWNGHGPDPKKQGFYPYDVIVSGAIIHKGEVITNDDTLGGSYFKPQERLGNIHGYLIQMLESVLNDFEHRDGVPAERLLPAREYLKAKAEEERIAAAAQAAEWRKQNENPATAPS